MSQGWVKLHRSLFENDIWHLEPFTKAQAWIDLFGNANHQPKTIQIRGNVITVNRGQLAWSEIKMSTKWGWSKNKVRRFLKWLEAEHQIEQQKDRYITTIITIINYDKYQDDTADETADDTAERQQKDSRRYINKNEKNEKNEKNIYIPADQGSSGTEVKKGFGNKYINELIDYLKTQSRLPALDETQENNRRYGYLLLNKYKETDEPDHTQSLKRLKMLIDYLAADKFWRPKVTSLVKLHKFSVTIYAQMEEKHASQRVSS